VKGPRSSVVRCALCCALLLAALPGAHAEPARAEEAAALRSAGERCYRKRDYRCALEKFERGFSLTPIPEMRFNMASAQDKLGLRALAVRQYRIYLREAGTGTPPRALLHIQRRLKVLAPRIGQITLHLSPAEARVLINGSRFPLEDLRSGEGRFELVLDPGSYQLQVDADGYLSQQHTLTIEAGEQRSLRVALAKGPLAERGALYLESQPAGARIFIDGRRHDAVTPSRIHGLATGQHRVRLATRTGVYECEVRIEPGEEENVSAALQPAVAKLVIESEPAGARVELDGRAAGQTPLTVGAVVAGGHVVKIQRDGYEPWSARFEVTGWGDRTMELRARLRPRSRSTPGIARPVLPVPMPRMPVGLALGRRDASLTFTAATEQVSAISLNLSGHWALLRWLQVGLAFSALEHGLMNTGQGPQEMTDIGELRLLVAAGLLEARGNMPALAAHAEVVLPTHTEDSVPREVGLHAGVTATLHSGRFTASGTGGVRWATSDVANPLAGFVDLYCGARILPWITAQMALQITGYLEPKMDQPAVALVPGIQVEPLLGLMFGAGIRIAATDVGRLLYTKVARTDVLLNVGYRLW
jgi:hypothetical protein